MRTATKILIFPMVMMFIVSNLILQCKAIDATSFILGDVNGNGEVEIGDALMIFKDMAGIEKLDSKQRILADIDGDGEAAIADALLIFKYVAGIDVPTNPQGYVVGDTVKIEQEEIDMSKMPEIIVKHGIPEIIKGSFFRIISDELPDVDLSDFLFEQRFISPYAFIGSHASKNGDRAFSVYYKNVPLYPEKYDFILRESADGGMEVLGELWENKHLFENARNLDFEPIISEQDAIQISREYCEGLPIPGLSWVPISFGEFTPDKVKRYGKEFVIYNLEELKVAYKTLASSLVKTKYTVNLYMDVDIKTGEVLEHKFYVTEPFS